MFERRYPIDDPGVVSRVARLIADARTLIGWSQQELADRAGTSQATVSRVEATHAGSVDLGLIARLLAALGLRGTLDVQSVHLQDRARQRDPVHARLMAATARHLERAGWSVATEVPIDDPPRGWIDLLAHCERDGAGLVVEAKGDLDDIGGLQRQVTFYVQGAHRAAAPLGWRMSSLAVLVVALDSGQVLERVRDNRALLARAFPGDPGVARAWIDAGGPTPEPTLAAIDPTSRAGAWLLRTPLSGRRSAPAFRDYADAAEALRTRRRRRAGPPRTRLRPARSRAP